MVYARPALCRLCGFPAPDGGVPVSEVDRKKLSEWCLRMMDTELDQEGLNEAVFCLFCVWQARILQENCDPSEKTSLPIWWKRCDILRKSGNDYKYLLDDIVQPCFVQIENLSAKHVYNLSKKQGIVGISFNFKKEWKKVFKCLYCTVQFSSWTKLKHHVTDTHQDKPIFSCTVCKKMFHTKSEHSSHLQNAHKNKFLCIYCGVRFMQCRPLTAHMKKWHNKEAIQCKYNKKCGQYFKSQAEREEHVKKVHESGAKSCVYCNKFIKANMSKHVGLYHRSEGIKCAACCTFFHTEADKVRHFEQVHLGNRGGVECIYCRKLVSSLDSGLKKHMDKYHASDALRCHFIKTCPTYFLTEEERRRHIQDVHEVKILQCIYCDKTHPDFKCLTKHVKRVHSDVMIKCKWYKCRQFVLSEAELDEHFQQKHAALDQEKSLQCELCSYKTREVVSLKHHVLVHHSAENLQCPECPKVFKSQLSLTGHIRFVHTFKPQQRCSTCQKTVKNMRNHLRTNKCLNCDFVATCRIESMQHRKICAKK